MPKSDDENNKSDDSDANNDSDGDNDDQPQAEMLAPNRSRRSNAGSKMSKLLEEEDEDEFYKTTYGGFEEEADDDDYKSEDSVSDVADSDIDAKEEDDNDDQNVDPDKEVQEKKKTKSIYKDPKKRGQQTADRTPAPKRPKAEGPAEPRVDIPFEKKSIRKSTAEKSKHTEHLMREREAKVATAESTGKKRRRGGELRRLTQEELLAETKITEELNLASLAQFQQMELERRKPKSHTRVRQGPSVVYRSVTMPADYLGDVTDETVDSIRSLVRDVPASEKCSRNFVTFDDETVYESHFPFRPALNPPRRRVCAVTGLPAKYMDPLSGLPYATLEAFKVIREACEKNNITRARVQISS